MGPDTATRYFEISVQVDQDWRKKGIGTRLYEEITTFASEQKANALQAPIRETQSHDIEWAERRGFIKTSYTFASELSLPQFDPNSFNASITAAESTGLRFISLEGYPQDDESFKRFVDFYWNLALDSPGMEGKPRPSFEEMKRIFAESGIWDPEGVILAVDGHHWAAMSFMIKRSDDVYYIT
jgi:GNAT superfamily N-acetyltransferase